MTKAKQLPNRLFGVGLYHVVDPAVASDHKKSHNAFEYFGSLTNGVKGQDRYTRKAAEQKGCRNPDHPNKAAVEKQGRKGLSARTQGEIRGVRIGVKGHYYGVYADH